MKGEVDLAWERLKGIPSIGITGTNGKTTVTNMLNHVLKLNHLMLIWEKIGQALSKIALEKMKSTIN